MTIRLKKELWEKVTRAARLRGYSSVDEFAEHVLEREAERVTGEEPDDEVTRRLRGLGYID